jgi:hypothetical protein
VRDVVHPLRIAGYLLELDHRDIPFGIFGIIVSIVGVGFSAYPLGGLSSP